MFQTASFHTLVPQCPEKYHGLVPVFLVSEHIHQHITKYGWDMSFPMALFLVFSYATIYIARYKLATSSGEDSTYFCF